MSSVKLYSLRVSRISFSPSFNFVERLDPSRPENWCRQKVLTLALYSRENFDFHLEKLKNASRFEFAPVLDVHLRGPDAVLTVALGLYAVAHEA